MFDFLKTKKNYEDVNAATFNTLMSETPDGIILDVRTSDEFKQSSMNGAINIDIMASNFTQKVILGGMFILQSILNIGCCKSNGCSIPQNKNHEKVIQKK